MGVSLTNVEGHHQHLSWSSYRDLLGLAYEYGWKPCGTEPGQWYDENGELNEQMSPDPEKWSGRYFSNDYQWVTDEDAANIADALERALEDQPNSCDEGFQWVRDFIAFCRAGAFSIA